MNADLFMITCQNRTLGRFETLAEAIEESKRHASNDWLDLVLWRSDELLGVVTAGGDLQLLSPATWITADVKPDAVVSLDLIKPNAN